MKRAAPWLLTAGVLLFIVVLASQGLPAVIASLAQAGWGLLFVAPYHLLPLVLDAAAIRVLFDRTASRATFGNALLARWAGESAGSLLPAGQIGGPVLMARHLARRGMPLPDAAAAITVNTTLQTFAQIAFALAGIVLLGAQTVRFSPLALRTSCLIATGVFALQAGGFYWMQRRGLFGKIVRAAARVARRREWSGLMSQAEAIDRSVVSTYGRGAPLAASFGLNLVGWIVGTGEVYFVLILLGSAVSWTDAFVLESLGQAIRSAAFAIPGALGVQEGGYLLLAPLTGLQPGTALALSLAKRTRELLLGLPGLLYLHWSERLIAAARP